MGALPSSGLPSAKASLLETNPINRDFFDLWNAADCTKEQILPKYLLELYVCPEGGCCVLGELRSAFPTAPCSSRVRIPEPRHLGGSMILPLAGTKAVQQRWLLKFQVQEGLEPDLACCACGGSCLPSVSEVHLQAGSGGAPALVTAGSEQLELGSLHGTLQARALL